MAYIGCDCKRTGDSPDISICYKNYLTAEDKVALVIGSWIYSAPSQKILNGSRNDAIALATKLEQLDFKVRHIRLGLALGGIF